MNFVPYNPAVLQVAGLTLPLQGLKILKSQGNANRSSGAYDVSLGSITRGIYQVPASKTFTLWAVRVQWWIASGVTVIPALVYTDNSLAYDGGTAMTNPIGLLDGVAGTPSSTSGSCLTINTWGSYGYTEIPLGGQAPTGKYVGSYSATAALGYAILMYGYEV